jgi:hypothetical protein
MWCIEQFLGNDLGTNNEYQKYTNKRKAVSEQRLGKHIPAETRST